MPTSVLASVPTVSTKEGKAAVRPVNLYASEFQLYILNNYSNNAPFLGFTTEIKSKTLQLESASGAQYAEAARIKKPRSCPTIRHFGL